jgi:Protein of unknown function (DUF2523)
MSEFFTRYSEFIPTFLYKAMVYLGIGVISFKGYDAILSTAQSFINSSLESSDYYDFLAFAGIIDAVHYLLTGITIRLTLIPVKRFGIIKD